jgi:hypothetical protein
MNNYYLISIDLNNINNYTHHQTDNIDNLINNYYNLDYYDFSKDNLYYDEFINKYNIKSDDLISVIYKYLDNPEKYLNYNKGLITFDLSIVNQSNIYSNINFLVNNYDKVILNKIYDHIYIYFSDKLSKTNKLNIEDSLKNLFIDELNNLLLWQKIKNIPNLIKNKHMMYKMKDDLSYLDNIKHNIYNKFFTNLNENNINTSNYEKCLINDLNSNNYIVNYLFDENVKKIDPEIYSIIFKKLEEYNIYLDDIIDQITNNQTNNNKIINLFNVDYLNELYNDLTNNIRITMNDVFNKNYNIEKLDSELINKNDFFSNIIVFLNELIKRKMMKTIKVFNLMSNINI